MWRQICRLAPRAWALVLEIVVIAVGVEWGLRRLSLPRLLALLRRLPAQAGSDGMRPSLEELQRLTAAVLRRAPFPMTCLKQTLIVFAVLRRRGLPADLKIGLAKHGDLLQAHAWIEQDGRVLLDDPDVAQRFPGVMPLVSYP